MKVDFVDSHQADHGVRPDAVGDQGVADFAGVGY